MNIQGRIQKAVLTSTAAFAGLLLAWSSAKAAQPVKFSGTISGTEVLTGIAPFPITVEYVATVTEIDYFDSSGALVRIYNHSVEQDIFSANGKTLVGEPYTYNIEYVFDSSGNLIRMDSNGIASKVRLPGGGLFQSSGQVDWLAHPGQGWILLTDKGSCVNLEGLIAALSP